MIKKINYNYLIIGFVVLVVIFSLLSKKDDTSTNQQIQNNENNNSGKIDTNQIITKSGNTDGGNYYETETTVKTKEIDNIEKKLQEEGRIEGATLYFDKNGFIDPTKEFSFKQNSNIKLEINAGDTGLKDGTTLTLLIPGASLEAQITIPGRYKYSMFFNKGGEQEIILKGKGLKNGKITKKILLR